MSSTPESAAPGPEAPVDPAFDGAEPGLPAPEEPPAWARRLVRIALWLLLWALIGLVLAGAMLVVAATDDRSVFTGDPADYPAVNGPTAVTIEDQTMLVVYYELEATFPDGVCAVTGPDGAEIPRAMSEPVWLVELDGRQYVGEQAFPVTGPGEYTVVCDAEGYRAGPGFRTREMPHGVDLDAVFGGLLLTTPGLVLAAVPALPLLLAALVVRLVGGPRPESRARRRFERPLALAIAAAIGAVSSVAVLLIVITGGTVRGGDLLGAAVSLSFLIMALPSALFILLAAGAGLLAVRRRPRHESLDLTGP